MAAIHEQVRQIMAQVFDVDPESIDEGSSRDTIEGWDSLQHLNLVLSLEEAFGVRFQPEDIARMRSFAEVLSALDVQLSTPDSQQVTK
ncbi:MAG: acyl carrier protein [Chloroflexota bacterium]